MLIESRSTLDVSLRHVISVLRKVQALISGRMHHLAGTQVPQIFACVLAVRLSSIVLHALTP
jgi:hypothetical protein